MSLINASKDLHERLASRRAVSLLNFGAASAGAQVADCLGGLSGCEKCTTLWCLVWLLLASSETGLFFSSVCLGTKARCGAVVSGS